MQRYFSKREVRTARRPFLGEKDDLGEVMHGSKGWLPIGRVLLDVFSRLFGLTRDRGTGLSARVPGSARERGSAAYFTLGMAGRSGSSLPGWKTDTGRRRRARE